MSANAPFPRTLDLGVNGGAITFQDFDAFRAWLQNESDAFKWIASVGGDSGFGFAGLLFKSGYRAFVTRANDIPNQPPEAHEQLLERLLSDVESAFSSGASIHSQSPAGAFVLALRTDSDILAAGALHRLKNRQEELRHPKAIEGMIRASMFLLGLDPTENQLQKTHLAKQVEDWSATVAHSQETSASLVHSSEETLRQANENKRQAETDIAALISDSRGKVEAEISDTKKKLKDFQAAVTDEIALQSPVTFWRKKEKRHGWGAAIFGLLVVLSFSAGGVLLYLFGQHLLDQVATGIGKAAKQITFADVPLLLISIFVVGVLVFVWIERILVRIFLSHVHLRSDAGERVVMAMTYLALLKEGAGPKDDDRKLILAALFRPSSTGVVTDDAAPQVWDFFSRQMDKPK